VVRHYEGMRHREGEPGPHARVIFEPKLD
jgi:hypothetical protein